QTTGRGRNAFGGRRLFQRGECQGLPACRTRTADRNGPSAASSPAWRALRKGGAPAGKSDAGRGHGPSVEDARRPQALCFAQADAGAGVRRHQIGARIPSVLVARPRQSARRVEPRDDGVEFEADVRPHPRLTRPPSDPAPAKQAPEATRIPPLNRAWSPSKAARPFTSPNRPRQPTSNPESDRLLGGRSPGRRRRVRWTGPGRARARAPRRLPGSAPGTQGCCPYRREANSNLDRGRAPWTPI